MDSQGYKPQVLIEFLYDEDEMPLFKMIKEGKADEARDYVEKFPILSYKCIRVEASHLYFDIDKSVLNYLLFDDNPRHILIINPDKSGFNPYFKGCENIFSQSKKLKVSAIHLAAKAGMVDVVDALLAKAKACGFKDYVNLEDSEGRTTLHYAAMGGCEEMILHLLDIGADRSAKERNQSREPRDLLFEEKDYDKAFLRKFYDVKRSKLPIEQNLLYQRIAQKGDEEEIKRLAKSEFLFIAHDPFVEKAREVGSEKLANYLSFLWKLREISRDFQLNFVTLKERDEDFGNRASLAALKAVFDLNAEYNATKESQIYNIRVTDELLLNMAYIAHRISYKFRENSYDLIPWQNIESLGPLMKYMMTEVNRIVGPNFPALFGFMHDHNFFDSLFDSIKNLGEKLYKLNEDGSIRGEVEPLVRGRVNGLEAFYVVTDSNLDSRSIAKIAAYFDAIHDADFSRPHSIERYALLAMIKNLGELSKYSKMSVNLTPMAKSFFEKDIPWKIFEELRDYLAKAPIRPKSFAIYKDLLGNLDESRLIKLKADIADIALSFKNVLEKKYRRFDRLYVEYLRGFRSGEVLSERNREELLRDLSAEIKDTKRRAKKDKQESVLKRVESYFGGENLENFDDIKHDIFGSFFKGNKFMLKKWTDIFQERSGVYSELEQLYDDFKSSRVSESQDFMKQAEFLVNKLFEFVIVDEEVIDEIKRNYRDEEYTSLARSTAIKKNLEKYRKSPILRLAIEQVYSELWLISNKMGKEFEMSAADTRFRNIIEHKNVIYDDPITQIDRDRGTFLNFVGASQAFYGKIEDYKAARALLPSASPSSPAVGAKGSVSVDRGHVM